MFKNLALSLSLLCFTLPTAVSAHSSIQNNAELLQACGDTRMPSVLSTQAAQELMNNAEGTPGPRRLVTEMTSNMVSWGSKRLIRPYPGDLDQLTLEVEKLSGSLWGGSTRFVVCTTDEQGQLAKVTEFTVPGGRDNIGKKQHFQLSGLRDKRLSIRLQGQDLLGQARFRLDLQRPGVQGQPWQPRREAPPGPVPGFADVHVHQTSDLAFAGGWYWGSHREGPLHERLPACTGYNHATLNLPFKTHELADPHPDKTSGAPDYHDWPRWNDIKHQQVSAKWLKDAHDGGFSLMVASLVNDQWLALANILGGTQNHDLAYSDTESVKHQLRSLQQMADQVPWYTIVRDPWEARRAIHRGELAVFLAVEVNEVLPSSDGPWRQQLYDFYDMGVRTIQLAHETNTRFSGAAYHREVFKNFTQLKALFSSEIDYVSEGDGIYNPLGLSDMGRELIQEMMRLNMLIDITHLPLKAQREIYALAAENNYYPLYNSHTHIKALMLPRDLEKYKEHLTPDEVMEYLRETGGVVGLRTGDEAMLDYTPQKGKKVENNCDGSIRSFIQAYQYLDDHRVNVAFASDFNGFITQTTPRFGPEACALAADDVRSAQAAQQGTLPADADKARKDFAHKGLAHVGLLPEMLKEMKRLGADTDNLANSSEAFLKMWERAYDPHRQRVP